MDASYEDASYDAYEQFMVNLKQLLAWNDEDEDC